MEINNNNKKTWWGDFNETLNMKNPFSFKETFSGKNVAQMFKEGLGDALGTAVGSAAYSGLSGGKSSDIGEGLYKLGSTASGFIKNPIVRMGVETALGTVGGGLNSIFGSKLNKEKINEIKRYNSLLNNLRVDDSSTSSVINQYANQDFGFDFSQSDLGEDGIASHRVRDIYEELKPERAFSLARAHSSFDNALNNVNIKTGLGLLANSSAFGGPIEMRTIAPMSPFGNRFANGGLFGNYLDTPIMDRVRTLNREYPESHSPLMTLYTNHIYRLPELFNSVNIQKNGGPIHIKKENRGKFTDYCGGKVTTECINRGKNSPNPLTRKRAVFAANARNWHEDGGPLFTHGAVFDNGLTFINNGGSHSTNPLGGVPMGVDQEGNPNLVEAKEVIWNTKDYVFSDRLKVPKKVRNKYKLRGTKDLTFADAVKQIQKESEERPNDPISKRGLEEGLNEMAFEQELIRQKDMINNNKENKFAIGGLLPLTSIMSLPEFQNNIKKEKNSDTKTTSKNSPLRYAPVVGSALGLMQNILDKPDYSRANALINQARRASGYKPVGYTPIGNYLTYNPFDTEFYANKLGAQAAANRRAVEAISGDNRGRAIASLLASDYNAQNQLGDLYKKAEEYNLGQRERVETFNRGTNQANAEMQMKADTANQGAFFNALNTELGYLDKGLAMKEAIDAAKGQAIAANTSGIFEGLGDIGRENFSMSMIKNNPYLLYDYLGNYKKKNGGYLTIKNKRIK